MVQHRVRKTHSILLVDDDVSLLESVKVLLERNGYQVTKACSGRDAAQAIGEESYDLLLTDALFPGRRSLQAVIDLGKRKAPARIIAMNSLGRFLPDYYLTLTRKLGVERIIAKPFKEEELLAAIDEVLMNAKLAASD
jgi:two-component system OmpR family response regulator